MLIRSLSYIASAARYKLLDRALSINKMRSEAALNLLGLLGQGDIIGATDLVAPPPSQIGETPARTNRLRVLSCPFPIVTFTMKQHWRERYRHDGGRRWLRSVCAELFQRLSEHRSGRFLTPRETPRRGRTISQRPRTETVAQALPWIEREFPRLRRRR